MNPVVLVHLLGGLLSIAVAIPLIKQRIKMNRWYGIRLPASFASDEAWYRINQYGGELFLRWGILIGATALVGALVGKAGWVIYDLVSSVLILGGLIVVIVKVTRFARKGAGHQESKVGR